MKMTHAVLAAVLCSAPSLASAQGLAEAAAAEAARRGTPLPTTRTLTNADLPRVPAAPVIAPAAPMSAGDLAQRADAMTALRAVQSALAGGANASEFKKYFLDAKIKVDQLSPAPENNALREVTHIYEDATTLMIAHLVRSLDASQVRYLKQEYGRDYRLRFLEIFKVSDNGFGSESSSLTRDVEASRCHFGAQVLLHYAGEKFRDVK